MSDLRSKINYLEKRLEDLARYQTDVQNEIRLLRSQLESIKSESFRFSQPPPVQPPEVAPEGTPPPVENRPYISPFERNRRENAEPTADNPPPPNPGGGGGIPQTEVPAAAPLVKSDLERFIGENLISLVGIAITALGVAIGTKYAYDHDWIRPGMLIILFYLFGFALLAIAFRLKARYNNFSAVLLSGGVVILYFVTYFAFALYQLISQTAAFALMLIFTVFTVFMSLIYNRVIIAHFALVGAYTIPFLLSTGSANYPFFFSYITTINLGILAVSVKKYWRSLFYSAFCVSWLIYLVWFATAYRPEERFGLALGFAAAFFLIFLTTFLVYKTISGERFTFVNVSLILSNAFIFYGFGYAIINSREGGDRFLGLFTAVNALFYLLIGFALGKLRLGHRSGIILMTALVLTFATIAIPVQFDGNWITLIWTAEALFLFWTGRTGKIPLFEFFSYSLMMLASSSLFSDLIVSAVGNEVKTPLFNPEFLTSLIYTAAFGALYFINRKNPPEEEESGASELLRLFYQFSSYVFPAIFLLALYNTFRTEIGQFFFNRVEAMKVPAASPGNDSYIINNQDLNYFNGLAQINYTMLFLSVLSLVNIRKVKDSVLGFVGLGLNSFAGFIFITLGLFLLFLLRKSFLSFTDGMEVLDHTRHWEMFRPGPFYIGARYICIAFFAALCLVSHLQIKKEFLTRLIPGKVLTVIYDLFLHFAVWIIVSSELINWMDLFHYNDSFKLGISILWGTYALFLVALGIYFNKKHLRIAAIALFTLVLAKLFFYDRTELDTISKTIVFVSLGILLLTISFLYNKYKHLIFEGISNDEKKSAPEIDSVSEEIYENQ
ncbi:MAG: DUF2339 domain-containing protein [Pyrinomonadaceae bacterium]